jgi:hypothetical protein
MAKEENEAEVASEEGYGFECPRPGCGFRSDGWRLKKHSVARAKQHDEEHETGEPMPELADFKTHEGIDY